MTTPAFSQIIDIPHRCSAILCSFYIAVILLVLLAALLSPLSLEARSIVLFVAMVGFVDIGRRLKTLLTLDKIIVRDGHIELMMANSTVVTAIVGSSVVTEYLIACTLRDHRQTQWWRLATHLILLPDSIAPEHHRQLRVLLNTGKLR